VPDAERHTLRPPEVERHPIRVLDPSVIRSGHPDPKSYDPPGPSAQRHTNWRHKMLQLDINFPQVTLSSRIARANCSILCLWITAIQPPARECSRHGAAHNA